ncbi:acyl-CoA dehydrogenase [Rhodococcus sp. SBT000017]|nr:acyl-CoA dehydrogenase [Rhodococcus sp. SBT000017]
MDEAVLSRVCELAPVIRSNARAAEDAGWLTPNTIDALTEAGVYSMAVPRRFGGLEQSLADQNSVLAEIARSCGSAGWVSMVWVSTAWMVSLFPDRAQEEVFKGGRARVSGGFTPGGTLMQVEDGYMLSGSWPFNTGSRGADWNLMDALVKDPDGEVVGESVALVPLSQMTLSDDWNVSAAGGTGSVTSKADNIFVPFHRVADAEAAVMGTLSNRSNAGATGRNYGLYSYVQTQSLATVAGMGQGAYDLFVDRLPGRAISHSSWDDQSDHPLTHIHVATAANKIAAAKALLEKMTTLLQSRADVGVEPSWQEKADIRGQVAFGIELIREAVDLLYRASGASVISKNIPLQRFHRDIQGFAQHGLLQTNTSLEVQGRMLLGLDPQNHFL